MVFLQPVGLLHINLIQFDFQDNLKPFYVKLPSDDGILAIDSWKDFVKIKRSFNNKVPMNDTLCLDSANFDEES